jgi:hypothetical protein
MESPPAEPAPAPRAAVFPSGKPHRPNGEPRVPREGETGNQKALNYQEMCVWLCQRAEQMDEKQQDRWQRILRSILGRGGGRMTKSD